MAEALLYLDKIPESIENLNVNARLEFDNDISFIPMVGPESESLDLSDSFKSIFIF